MAGAHTQHSKASLTSSGINLAMPKCENTFFVPKNVCKVPKQANPIKAWTIEPICAHTWVRPSICQRPICSFFLSSLDLSYYCTNVIQTSQIDSLYSKDLHIIFWSRFIEFSMGFCPLMKFGPVLKFVVW